MDNFNFKNFINENNLGAYSKLEGRLFEDEDTTYALHITTVEYDNGEMGYTYEVVDLDTEEEVGSEFGFKPLYFVGKGDESDKQVFKGKDFNSIKTSGMYQDEVINKEMALYIYNGLLKGDDFYGDKISFDPRELAPGADANLEAKKRDVDGDGDIDSDDYMAAKDAAIKKAMGKTEEVSEDRFVASSMEDLEQVIRNLAHTANISEDEALEMAIKKLENMLDGRDDMDEDLDVGHQDDEPNMLKKTMYRTAKMASMIYKELDKFDQFPNEVDFPNWWQAKLIKANDYLNAAFDYLDGEQQTAKLDAVTHENAVSEKKIEVDDDTDFKVKLSHLLDKHVTK